MAPLLPPLRHGPPGAQAGAGAAAGQRGRGEAQCREYASLCKPVQACAELAVALLQSIKYARRQAFHKGSVIMRPEAARTQLMLLAQGLASYSFSDAEARGAGLAGDGTYRGWMLLGACRRTSV